MLQAERNGRLAQRPSAKDTVDMAYYLGDKSFYVK